MKRNRYIVKLTNTESSILLLLSEAKDGALVSDLAGKKGSNQPRSNTLLVNNPKLRALLTNN